MASFGVLCSVLFCLTFSLTNAQTFQSTASPSAQTASTGTSSRNAITVLASSINPGPTVQDSFSSFSSGITNMPPTSSGRKPPPFADGDRFLIDVDQFCKLDEEPDKGGLIIGGFFDGHATYNSKTGRCIDFLDWGAAELTESFRFAAEKIENYIINWSILGRSSAGLEGKKIFGMYVRDTCTSGLMGMAQAQTLALNASVFVSQAKDSVAKRTKTSNDTSEQNSTLDSCQPPFVMLIGPGSSEETAAVSPLLSNLKIPHISFWATSTQFNDISEYPYLFRTVPSDDYQAAALADIIEHFGWTYVILIGASDEIYSGRGMELIKEEAQNRGTFCIAFEARFSERNPASMQDVALLMNDGEYTDAKVIVIIAPVAPARFMLQAMLRANITGKVILGSNDWVNRLERDDLLTENAVLGLSPKVIGKAMAKSWANDLWLEMIKMGSDKALLHSRLKFNPWLLSYMENAVKCHFPVNPDCRDKLQTTAQVNFPLCNLTEFQWYPPDMQRAESLMYALELAGYGIFYSVYKNKEYSIDPDNDDCNYPRGDIILESLRNLKAPCDDNPSGQCFTFNEHQSGWPVYRVKNWNHQLKTFLSIGIWDGRNQTQKYRLKWNRNASVDFSPSFGLYFPSSDNRTNVPESSCSRTCLPGEERHFHILYAAQCCWQCLKCGIQAVSSRNNSDNCESCKLGEKPNADQSACLVINVEKVSFSNPWGAVLTVFAVLGAVVSILTLAFFWRFRTCYLVRASDLYLTTAILIGVILGHLSSLLLLVEPSDVTCHLPPILTAPWAILTSAGILVKTNRFNIIFSSSLSLRSSGRGRRFLFSTGFQLTVVGVLTAVCIIIGIVRVITSPPVPEKIYPDSNTVFLICSTSNEWIAAQLAYLVLLLVICAILAFQTRKLPDNYNEARHIAMAAFTTCVVWLGFSPAVFVTESSLRPVIMAIALVAQMWAVWTCLYVPRLVPMLRSQEVRTLSKPKSTGSMPGNVRMLPSTGSSACIQDERKTSLPTLADDPGEASSLFKSSDFTQGSSQTDISSLAALW